MGRVPVTRRKAVARMLKAIHAQESREACSRKAAEVADELDGMRLGAAARTVRDDSRLHGLPAGALAQNPDQ